MSSNVLDAIVDGTGADATNGVGREFALEGIAVGGGRAVPAFLVAAASAEADPEMAVCVHRLGEAAVTCRVGWCPCVKLGFAAKPIDAKISSSSDGGGAFFGCVGVGFFLPRLVIWVGTPPIEDGRSEWNVAAIPRAGAAEIGACAIPPRLVPLLVIDDSNLGALEGAAGIFIAAEVLRGGVAA